MSVSYWPKSTKILIIILSVLLAAETYFLYDSLKHCGGSEVLQGVFGVEPGSSYQEVMPKVIMGNIIEISSSKIKIKATQIGETLLSSGKEQEKEIIINADTKLRKYDPKLEGADNVSGIVEAKISDFKKGDQISIQTDKNANELNLTAVDIQLIFSPTT